MSNHFPQLGETVADAPTTAPSIQPPSPDAPMTPPIPFPPVQAALGVPPVIAASAQSVISQSAGLASVEPQKLGPVLMCMADVEARQVAWLWDGRFACGCISVVVGRPGLGKSFLTTDMAARISRGAPWPDGSSCAPGSVILISAEDDPHYTIRPRLDAHGANVRKVHAFSMVRKLSNNGKKVDEVLFSLADVAMLEDALKTLPDCRLIVIDPIGSFLGGKVDANSDNEVRSVLAPVAALAARYGVAVVVVAHTKKGAVVNADDAVLGSRAFTGIARSVYHLMPDKEDEMRRLFLPGKNNLAPEGHGLAFSIQGKPGAVVWEEAPVMMTANDVLALENNAESKKDSGNARLDEALKNALLQAVPNGLRLKEDLLPIGESLGKGKGAVYGALRRIGAQNRNQEFGGEWRWSLPSSIPPAPPLFPPA